MKKTIILSINLLVYILFQKIISFINKGGKSTKKTVIVLVFVISTLVCMSGKLGLAVSAGGTATSYTNFIRLQNYIDTNGSVDTEDNCNMVTDIIEHEGNIYLFVIKNKDAGICFQLFSTSEDVVHFETSTEFILYSTNKMVFASFSMHYYYNGTCMDEAQEVFGIDRSAHSSKVTYTACMSGTHLTTNHITKTFNQTLELLCDFWDEKIYSSLGFGLKGLGFISYDGLGVTVCDVPSSHHKGHAVIKNYVAPGCVSEGYTGDKYCSLCNEKISRGKFIMSLGGHTYDNDCDSYCNVCGEERLVSEHIYDDESDMFCNECGYERPAYIPGDIDGNVGITDADAEYLLMYTFFSDYYPVNQDCDFNEDGFVNDADAEYLLMYTFFPEDYPLKLKGEKTNEESS